MKRCSISLILEKFISKQWDITLSQEGEPLPGPERGFLSNTQKLIIWGDTLPDKARVFIGKGCLGGEQEGKGNQEDCSATWLTASSFIVMGLVSRLSLANLSDSESFLEVHILLKPVWIPTRRILRGSKAHGVSYWPFPNSLG